MSPMMIECAVRKEFWENLNEEFAGEYSEGDRVRDAILTAENEIRLRELERVTNERWDELNDDEGIYEMMMDIRRRWSVDMTDEEYDLYNIGLRRFNTNDERVDCDIELKFEHDMYKYEEVDDRNLFVQMFWMMWGIVESI